MSLDKIQLQAERWLRTAEEDLEAAQAGQVRRSCPRPLAQWLRSGVRDVELGERSER